MPLNKSKSKSAFVQNVKTEMNAGKPQKQALAIAYNLKRKSNKYAKGGMVEADEPAEETMDGDIDQFLSAEDAHNSPFLDQQVDTDEQELEENDNSAHDESSNEHGDADQDEARAGVLEQIMRKVRMRNMSK